MKYLKHWQIFEKKSIKDTESYRDGNYHQAIMDIAYNKWGDVSDLGNQDLRSETTTWGYSDVFEFMGKYGPEFQLLLLIGKYDQQVNNGGHSQYYENGYASLNARGSGSEKDNIELHFNMMKLMESTGLLDRNPVCKSVFEIMRSFGSEMEDYDDHCGECDGGSVEEECSDCDGDEEDCGTCDGDGNTYEDCDACEDGFISPNVSYLDSKYYDINDEFMYICNTYSKEVLDDKLG